MPRWSCAASVFGVDWLVSRLTVVAKRAASLLSDCSGGDRVLCKRMLALLREVTGRGRLAVFLAIPTSGGVAVDAVYAENRDGGWIVFSPHVLADPGYAVHVLIHELAHAIGLEEDDIAEALVLYTTGANKVLEPPEAVREAEELLRKKGCIVELANSPMEGSSWPPLIPVTIQL